MSHAMRSGCFGTHGGKGIARRRYSVEGLERRRLLAAVSWDGGGDGTNWTDPINWSGNALPQAADDVTISVVANPTILIPSGTQSIKSLVTDEAIRTTGGTLAVATTAQATQSVTVAGGGLSGGAWALSGGSSVLATSSGGALANVAITGGDLLLNVNAARVLVSGTTSFPAARLQASSANFQVVPGYILNSLIVAEGATVGSRTVTLASGAPGTITVGPSGVIRLAAGCGGSLTLQNANIATVVNNGLITAEAASRTLSIQNSTFTNNATTQVIAGTLAVGATNWSNPGAITAASGTTVNFSGTWSSAGTMNMDSATLNLGGTFSGFNSAGFTRTGGTVNLTGTLNNAASTLILDAVTGSWNLSGGTITNGTVNQTGGSVLAITSNGGTLANVAITGGDLLLNVNTARVLVSGTTNFPAARLQASSVNFQMAPGYVLNSLIVAEGAATGSRIINLAIGGAGTITVAPTGVIRLAADCGGNLSLQNASTATLVNNGLITAEAAGQTLFIQSNVLTHTGTLNASAGTLSVTPAFTNSGTISVDAGGSLTTAASLTNAGTLTTAGRITVAGLLDLQSGSTAVAQPGGTAVIRVHSLALAPNYALQLNDNDLIIDYTGASPITTIEGLVATAYNLTGDWQGNGITSNVAALDANFTLAVADNATLAAPFGISQGGPLFSGQDVDLTTVLVKFTHRADINLDGVITPDDSAIFGGNYDENQPAVWATGDINFDGLFTPDDSAIFGGFYDESLLPT